MTAETCCRAAPGRRRVSRRGPGLPLSCSRPPTGFKNRNCEWNEDEDEEADEEPEEADEADEDDSSGDEDEETAALIRQDDAHRLGIRPDDEPDEGARPPEPRWVARARRGEASFRKYFVGREESFDTLLRDSSQQQSYRYDNTQRNQAMRDYVSLLQELGVTPSGGSPISLEAGDVAHLSAEDRKRLDRSLNKLRNESNKESIGIFRLKYRLPCFGSPTRMFPLVGFVLVRRWTCLARAKLTRLEQHDCWRGTGSASSAIRLGVPKSRAAVAAANSRTTPAPWLPTTSRAGTAQTRKKANQQQQSEAAPTGPRAQLHLQHQGVTVCPSCGATTLFHLLMFGPAG